jgi:hypothetical protein
MAENENALANANENAAGPGGVQPPPPPPGGVSLSTLTVNPTSVVGGNNSQGTVTLTGAAPAGGAVVTLSDNSESATIPASVTVAAGATSATFAITTTAVTASTPANITGSFGGVSRQATLTVQPQTAQDPRDPRFFWLTVAQYVLIAGVTLIFAIALYRSVSLVDKIGDINIARGLITYVVTVGTIAIAMMLVISAIVTRDFNTRVSAGKEVLAILIGVLGTIVGFYYGAATKEAGANNGANNQTAQTSSAPVTITPPQLTSGPPATFSTKLSGGTAPYSYSVRFTPDTIPAIVNQESANGEINHQFTVPVPAGAEVTFFIEGTDKNKVAFEINKDGKQKITVR